MKIAFSKRGIWIASMAALALVSVVILASLQVVSNARFVEAVSKYIRSNAEHTLYPSEDDLAPTLSALRERTNLYISQIEAKHLLDGMVVNTRVTGQPEDICDSLLFSGIFYASLRLLQKNDLASTRWKSIESSHQNGLWYRHPQCRKTPASRDMMLGLLVALVFEPDHYAAYIRELYANIQVNKGFFAPGSASVSYLTPGVAEIFRKFSLLHHVSYSEMPDVVRGAFSTTEWSTALSKPGFRLHLVAMATWVEIFLNQKLWQKKNTRSFRTATQQMNLFAKPFVTKAIHEQRLEYITQTLVEKSPGNLFFVYLRYLASNALTPTTLELIAKALLAMPQFPVNRLPNDCDRRADYLWQRDEREYSERGRRCEKVFSGVDFVWMSALLQSGLQK